MTLNQQLHESPFTRKLRYSQMCYFGGCHYLNMRQPQPGQTTPNEASSRIQTAILTPM